MTRRLNRSLFQIALENEDPVSVVDVFPETVTTQAGDAEHPVKVVDITADVKKEDLKVDGEVVAEVRSEIPQPQVTEVVVPEDVKVKAPEISPNGAPMTPARGALDVEGVKMSKPHDGDISVATNVATAASSPALTPVAGNVAVEDDTAVVTTSGDATIVTTDDAVAVTTPEKTVTTDAGELPVAAVAEAGAAGDTVVDTGIAEVDPAAAAVPEVIPAESGETASVSAGNVEVTVTEQTGAEGATKIEIEVKPEEGAAAAATVADEIVPTEEIASGVAQTDVDGNRIDEVLDTPPVATEDLAVVTDEHLEEIEEELEEENRIRTEIVEEIGEAGQAVASLEAIAESLEAATQNGGLDRHGARVLKIATEHIFSKFSLNQSSGMPALESFDVKGARITATSISMEDIKGKIERIKSAIKAGMTQVVASLKKSYTAFKSVFDGLEVRANKLAEQAADLQGTPAAAQLVGMGPLASVGNTVASNTASEVERVHTYIKPILSGSLIAPTKKFLGDLVEIHGVAQTDQAAATARMKTLSASTASKLLPGMKQSQDTRDLIGAGKNDVYYTSAMFLGNTHLWGVIESGQDFSKIGYVEVNAGEHFSQSKAQRKAVVNTMSPAQIQATAKAVQSLMADVKQGKALESVIDAMDEAVDSALRNANEHFGVKNFPKYLRMFSGMTQASLELARDVSRNALRLAEASAKQYKAA